MHVIKEDLTRCPSCQFMAIRSEFMKYVSLTSIAYRNSIILKTIWYIYRLVDGGEPCPMCNNKISGNGALAVWTEPLKPKSNWSHLITCLFVFIFSTRPHSLKAPFMFLGCSHLLAAYHHASFSGQGFQSCSHVLFYLMLFHSIWG
jgi:hypothetical protein